ncbi:DUF512 domain-containing protein [Guggenheimella bovis]
MSLTSKRYNIKAVESGSIAEELDIQVGDVLLRVNDKEIEDTFDYLFQISQEKITVDIEMDDEIVTFDIEKEIDEDLGLSFSDPLMDHAKSCKNNCIFCFIDQLPKGLRKTLYFKDDDSRLSFMQGNFITLTNMSEKDLQRIVDLGIHPINVSVHTTNPQLRVEMTKNPRAKEIMNQLEFLKSHGVKMTAQIVLVPGFNDGKELQRTLQDLTKFYPEMHSVAIVPVGLTKHREGLIKLSPFTKRQAKEVIEIVSTFQKECLKKGTRFAFLADEFYLLAEEELPSEDAYEGYLHYEDGVGMVRMFVEAFKRELEKGNSFLYRDATFVTATAFHPFLVALLEEANIKYNMNARAVAVENEFLGTTINVNGLLSFQDVVKRLKGEKGPFVLCNNLLNFDQMTLDDKTVENFENELGEVVFVEPYAESLFKEKE